jgi:hypothetical protein
MKLPHKISHPSFQPALMPLMVLMMLSSIRVDAQKCDYVTGPITFDVQGGNMTDDYTTQYVLTDVEGNIVRISPTNTVDVFAEGFYVLYALNAKVGTAINSLAVGNNIDNVSGDCIDIGAPYPFTVCEDKDKCNYCLGEMVSLSVNGGNTEGSFVTKYVYTNDQGIILEILDEPEAMMLDTGVFVFFAINYDTTKPIVGLQIGEPLYEIQSVCADISGGYLAVVCDQLTPTIFFDLRSCDITETATLVVSGLFDSYEWSTGSTADFIDIPANVPATYFVTVTLSTGCIGFGKQEITGDEIASIGDFVWEDSNANGRQDAGEAGINGVRVNLYTDFDRNGQPDIPGFPSCITTTANDPITGQPGYYNFNVYRANYIVEFIAPNGFSSTEQNAIANDNLDSDINTNGLTGSIGILSGERRTDVDAGFRTSANVCGQIWNDANANGRREDTDQGVNDVTINLYNSQGVLVETTTTMTIVVNDTTTIDGRYCFEGVPVQSYYVEVIAPVGQAFTEANATGDDTRDSEVTGGNGPRTTDIFTTKAGETTNDIDAGIYQGGSICGIVFRDEDGGSEAVYDAGIDSLLNNVLVQLLDAESELIVQQKGTNSDGSYCFTGIPIGSYKVFFPSVGGMSLVTINVGDDPLLDSDADPNTLMTRVFFVAPVDTIAGINAGLRLGSVPVELVFFDGFWDRVKDQNVLSWQTASEINNEKFELQRTFENSGAFRTIATLKGQGTTLQTSNYRFVDKDIAASGSYYYRLKQIDYDGGYEYSNIKVIDVSRTKSSSSTDIATNAVYPNPANDYITITLTTAGKILNNIELIDVTGKIIRTWTLSGKTNGSTQIELSISDIVPGSYMLSVNTEEEVLQQQVQIVR